MNGEIAKWVIVGLAVSGLMFNTGVLFNDVKHLKKSVDSLWHEINRLKNIMLGE